jgi:hypothetical protein
MNRSRSALLTLPLFAAFALLCGRVDAQPDKDALPRPGSREKVNEAKEARGLTKADLPAYREQFKAFAKYYADYVAHPLVYKAGQDPSVRFDSQGSPIKSVEELAKEIDRFILEPNPFVKVAGGNPNPKVNFENADYIREMGEALDAAFKPLMKGQDRIVRVNATRLYAVCCKSGAAAHWPTVTELLKNQNTPTEVKYYALQAAGNLLSAYDVFDYKSRRHALSKEPRSDADKEIGALVAAIEKCVTDPNAVVAIPEGKVQNADPEQLAVVAFVRRQAIKALGQVRFITLPGPDGKPIYPAVTLAKVCMSDAALVPQPNPSECAEAVIGLCNMSPNPNGTPIKGFNPDALAEAVASGIITFASPRADPFNRSLPWRGYSMRLADAMRSWRQLFDPIFDPLQPQNADPNAVPKVIGDLVAKTQSAVLAPIDKVDATGKPDPAARVDIQGLKDFVKTVQSAKNRTGQLINGVPATALPGAARQ